MQGVDDTTKIVFLLVFLPGFLIRQHVRLVEAGQEGK